MVVSLIVGAWTENGHPIKMWGPSIMQEKLKSVLQELQTVRTPTSQWLEDHLYRYETLYDVISWISEQGYDLATVVEAGIQSQTFFFNPRFHSNDISCLRSKVEELESHILASQIGTPNLDSPKLELDSPELGTRTLPMTPKTAECLVDLNVAQVADLWQEVETLRAQVAQLKEDHACEHAKRESEALVLKMKQANLKEELSVLGEEHIAETQAVNQRVLDLEYELSTVGEEHLAETQAVNQRVQELEQELSAVHKWPAVRVFESGYDTASESKHIRIDCPGVDDDDIEVEGIPNGARVSIFGIVTDEGGISEHRKVFDKEFHFDHREFGRLSLRDEDTIYENGVLQLVLKKVQPALLEDSGLVLT